MVCPTFSLAACHKWLAFCLQTRNFWPRSQLLDLLLQVLILRKNPPSHKSSRTAWTCSVIRSCTKLQMKMVILALILWLAKKRLQIQGESLKQQAFIPSIFGNQSNHQNKKGSFTTWLTYLFNLGVWCVRKLKAELLSIRSRKLLPRPRRYSLTRRTSGSLKTKSQRPSWLGSRAWQVLLAAWWQQRKESHNRSLMQ